VISSRIGLSWRAFESGDVQAARMQAEGALELARQHHIPEGLGWSLSSLSELAFIEGDFAAAHRYSLEARSYFLQDAEGVANAEKNLAYTTCLFGDFAAARRHYHAFAYYARNTNNPSDLAGSLLIAASILTHDGHPERAAQVLGLAEAQWSILLAYPPS
jgi:uncharacterized membrane-anchored protein